MPRNRLLRGTSAHPRDTGSFTPYLEDFAKLIQVSDSMMKSAEIQTLYIEFINMRTDNSLSNDIKEQSQSGFRRSFRKLAIINKWRESTKPRGYFIRVKRYSRQSFHFVEYDHINRPATSLIHRLAIDSQKGRGVFASVNIAKGAKITEYMGEWITEESHRQREIEYARQGLPPVAISNSKKHTILDGNRNKNGRLFNADENIARHLNHSFRFPNCKLLAEHLGNDIQLYIVSKCSIPKGCECVWDYNERRLDVIAENRWLAS
ncbi:SETD8 [Mytilus coruscus]|uniref:SETD8 n=1 Tax=Mytilus coruscus TaxID=42192 RepID=A0A6J8ENJ0_MYTCO|nr:SETD8 [Mytilus coruscus]